jgi:hypothetical protein
MTPPAGTRTGLSPRNRRRGLLAAGAVGVALLVVGLVVGLVVVTSHDPSSTPSSTPSAAPSASPARTSSAPASTPATASAPSASAAPADEVDELPPSRPPVALGSPGAVGDGVTVSLTRIEAIDGTASGPGNVAGPALRVTVRITNGTSDPLALDGAVVDLAYGSDSAAASPLEDPSRLPFSGTLQPREDATGVYVFSVPDGGRQPVVVSVGYRPGAPYVVFRGTAG